MFLRMQKSLNARRDELKRDEGFTLIELLVVVIIIGILAAIAIPVFLGVQSNAIDSAVKSDLTNLKVAVVAYQTENNGQLPADLTAVASTANVDISATGNYGGSGVPPVFSSTGADNFCIQATGSNNNIWNVKHNTSPASGAC